MIKQLLYSQPLFHSPYSFIFILVWSWNYWVMGQRPWLTLLSENQTITYSLMFHIWLMSKQPPASFPHTINSFDFCAAAVGLSHLVRLPVSEEVDGPVQPPLDDGPAAGVVSLVAPHLHEPVGVLRLHQEHAASRVPVFQSLQTVLEGTWAQDMTRRHLLFIAVTSS